MFLTLELGLHVSNKEFSLVLDPFLKMTKCLHSPIKMLMSDNKEWKNIKINLPTGELLYECVKFINIIVGGHWINTACCVQWNRHAENCINYSMFNFRRRNICIINGCVKNEES